MSTIQAIMAELQAGEAAQARIPELERALQDVQAKLLDSQRHAQELELRAKLRDDTIHMLTEKVGKLTEERDDASFRVLEAEDRLSTFEKAVGNAWGGLGNAINALHPPKAEPVKEEPVTKPIFKPGDPLPGEGQSAPSPLATATQGSTGTSGPAPSGTVASTGDASGASQSGGEGQRASPPSVSGQAGQAAAPLQTAQPSGAGTTDDAALGHISHMASEPWKPSVEMPEVKPEEKDAGSGYIGRANDPWWNKPTDPQF